jgi:Armadillo/beta-catenin-like repeat
LVPLDGYMAASKARVIRGVVSCLTRAVAHDDAKEVLVTLAREQKGAVVTAIVAHARMRNADDTSHAAHALRVVTESPEFHSSVREAGGVGALVALVREGDASGKANAAGALWNLALGNEAMRASIREAGGISALESLVREGDASGKVNAENALRILSLSQWLPSAAVGVFLLALVAVFRAYA